MPSDQGPGHVRYLQTSDNVQIATAAAGHGPPLIHVRGWISHLELLWQDAAYRGFCETLGEHFRVIRYDCRGNGLSDWYVPRITIPSLVTDLETVVDELCSEPVVLYATAFGGPIAVAFAARHPDRVARLVLDGTYARGMGITSRSRQLFIRTMLKKFPEVVFLLLGYATNPSGSAPYRHPDIARQMIAPAVAAQLYTLAFNTDITPLLPSIRMPTLVLHKGGSRSIPVRLGRELAAGIAGARFHEIPGVAHNPWEGEVDATLAIVGEFLGVSLRRPGGSFLESGASPARRYELRGELGSGANGTVYRALDTVLGREVAVKVLTSLGSDRDAYLRFAREASLAARINHPCVCSVLDAGEMDGRPFLVLELLDGRTLGAAITEGLPHLTVVVEWMAQLLSGLSAAHRQSVLHRDIKPSNIFITTGGTVKLLDFGVAKAWRDADVDTTNASLTTPGAAVGTWAYMSPEQVRGAALDPRSDIFSLGVVFYQTFTGRNPFAGRSLPQTLDRILHLMPPPPHEVKATLPLPLSALIMKAIEKNPADRYQTAEDLRREVDQLRYALR